MTGSASTRPASPWRSSPGPLLLLAVVVGWLGCWIIYKGSVWGFLFPGLTTALVIIALRTVRATAQRQAGSLQEALDAAAARNRELDRLQKVSATLLAGKSLDELFLEVAEAAADLLMAEAGAIALVVEEGRFVRLVACTGPLADRTGSLLPVDGSLIGWAITHEQSLVCDDMDSDPRSFRAEGLRLRSTAVALLRSAGVVIGTVSVYNRHDGRGFTSRDIQLLQALGDQVIVGLDRAHVLEQSRQNQQALAAKNQELQRATELKSQFLANVSHELRTPLNAINGFSDLLLTEDLGPINETQREFVDSILRNGKHLLGLINSVLDLSKIEAGRMTLSLAETDLRRAILAAVTDTVSLRSAKQQECRVEMDPEAPLTVSGDGQRIRQILFNLLSNASKFTPEQGQVTIAAVATRAPLPIPGDRTGEQPRLVARDAVWVAVSDTGSGIKPEDMGRLFVEFSQVDSSASRRQQGTGLGLALCRKFVEMHGGTIGAESIHGRGSTFWFILPVEGPVRRRAAGSEG